MKACADFKKAFATRPLILISPDVGSVIRESSFKSVVLPAPLRPMMPITSPCFTSNDTSFSAQNYSVDLSDSIFLKGYRMFLAIFSTLLVITSLNAI